MSPFQSLITQPIPFREFMELALYHPEHGYYAGGRAALGRKGDYFTSVSVGPIFGQLLTLQFREMWDLLGRPADFTIVEQGAHDGTFANDVLSHLQRESPDFFTSLRYKIIEPFDIPRARQGEKLGAFPNVTWHRTLDELAPFTGVHFSNELIDAFPVHVVRFRAGQWRELCVTPRLEWTEAPIDDPNLRAQLHDIPQVENYTTEINLEALEWAKNLSTKLQRGWLLAIDYGFARDQYYASARAQGTLRGYKSHKLATDLLATPGEIDLTTHVDFTTLAATFLASGLTLAGYTDQHHFLTPLVAKTFAEVPPTPQQSRAIKTLLHPEMLGATFKVLAISQQAPAPITGLQFARDPRQKLGLP
jgi:SAM-dependent MidA family methyltransferase